ncbi:MAG: hypothetical protein KDN22_26685 [Verrucomicrobiae bacterium]|nr:hypothetical protein [Verrucomicrobiae bacterium]
MKQRKERIITRAMIVLAFAAVWAIHKPLDVFAKGGSGGGGGRVKVTEYRVTGYVGAIDYEKGTIQIGASYYGSGELIVTDSTDISLDNVSCSLDNLEIGDWVEARYVIEFGDEGSGFVSIATKLSADSLPTS